MSNLIQNLFLKGKVIKPYISIWGGRKKLSAVELGIDDDDVNDDLVTLGSKWLIPAEEIKDLEKIRVRANSLVEKHSMRFSFGSFVPENKIETTIQGLQESKIEFDEKIRSIERRYPELREGMIREWNTTALSISAKKEDTDLAFRIMSTIEAAFPSWEQVRKKFDFHWVVYDDINKLAEEFIEDVTRGILDKMVEFSNNLKQKIQTSGIQERNLKPVRDYIDAIQDSLAVLQSDKLNRVVTELESWVQDGSADQASGNAGYAKKMASALDGLGKGAEALVDSIVKESVDALSSNARKIKL